MAFMNGNDDGPVANVNVTPMVDVMTVLLVVFMITAPMLQQGVEVNLPKATTAPLRGSTEQIVLSVDKDGRVFLGAGNEIQPEELSEKMKAIMETRRDEDRKIYIKADNDLAYGHIMMVMGKLHQAGIEQIGLVSAPPEAPKKS